MATTAQDLQGNTSIHSLFFKRTRDRQSTISFFFLPEPAPVFDDPPFLEHEIISGAKNIFEFKRLNIDWRNHSAYLTTVALFFIFFVLRVSLIFVRPQETSKGDR